MSSKTKKSTKGRKKRNNKPSEINKEVIGVIIVSFGLLLLYSMNTATSGILVKLIGEKSWQLLGSGGYLLPYVIIIIGILFLINKLDIYQTKKTVSIFIIFICLITLFDIKFLPTIDGLEISDRIRISMEASLLSFHRSGGILGAFFAYLFLKLFGVIGSYIILFTILTINILYVTNTSLIFLIQNILKSIISIYETIVSFLKNISNHTNTSKSRIKKKTNKSKTEENKTKNIIDKNETKIKDNKIKILDYTKNEYKDNDTFEIAEIEKPEKKNIESPKENTKKDNESENHNLDSIAVSENEYNDYEYPSLDILQKSDISSNKKENKIILNNAKKLEDILKNFGIEAQVTQISRGPTITRYELQPAPGIKVSRIVNLSDDIALGLASSDIRIEAPIPGKAAIGIEVPNIDKSTVNLRDVLETKEYSDLESKLSFALGKDIAGKPIVANIEKMPHLLIAGATGSGKSVCINTLITSILYKSKPDEVKLLMIDPKVVELSIYNGIPHLLIPVVTDPKKASFALNWAVQEMNKRYNLFAENSVRDIKSYNSKSQKDESMTRLPQIVVIIDELADLMMVSPGEVEDSICRLAQMARAAGIHLIVATQRPSVDIITGTIKANIPSRISFAVSSQADSRTILDMGGAEKLLGKGDLLFYPVGASKPKRLQGAYIDEKEVEKIVSFLKKDNAADYKEEIIENIDKDINTEFDDTDELLPSAIELIIDEGQASISYLQRKLKVGYSRAARIVDEMEERGIVGPHEGSKPRKVLVTREELDN
ncbi:DNA translocase FtsK 4TM domain-containing protein [Clostridium sp. D2Q-11]|uniref:DNA translocase FtsK 4TM domain-containing protein n=1 Tax=Anaeromonas frigoriresistens TaxID=2683708 RepID=A0A942ZA22_9FIRM|nr:DNA translocase FtsK [Anaeromonas frigoriresistens]MBS4539903.1 DNA translocase FtsK 4TM domain-containing protein [Anaeromonas frigoriresistens]